MTTELYKKHRPRKLEDMIGQPNAVAILEAMFKKKDIPHTILLSGPSGTGKTTAARIIKRHLKCHKLDYVEMNGANDRGIEEARRLIASLSTSGWGKGDAPNKVFYIDECFAPGTQVQLQHGEKAIENVFVGDIVKNIAQLGRVTATFKNKVALDRVVKLKFDDGTTLFTTKQHKFFTDNGWVEAQDLCFKHCILSNVCYPTGNVIYYSAEESLDGLPDMWKADEKQSQQNMQPSMRIPIKNPIVRQQMDGSSATMDSVDMQMLRKPVQSKACKKASRNLWQSMRDIAACKAQRQRTRRKKKLSLVQSFVYSQESGHKKTLLGILCVQNSQSKSGVQREMLLAKSRQKDKSITTKVCQNYEGQVISEGLFGENASYQQNTRERNSQKSNGNKEKERDSAYLQRHKGRKWEVITGAKTTVDQSKQSMGGGTSNKDKERSRKRGVVSELLQSRLSQARYKTGNRSGWEITSVEKRYIERCKKDPFVRTLRLVDYAVYQQGDNDGLFQSVIGDKEKEQGFVEFYDLEVSGHPSYFANGLPVHNCHALTGPFQDCMLKSLEDTPEHVYFILATTLPSKLKKTIHTRATEIKFTPISANAIMALLHSVAKKEGSDIHSTVAAAIADAADGSARHALNLLDKVLHIEDKKMQLDCVRKEEIVSVSYQLFRALLNGRSWSDVNVHLKQLSDEPETVRCIILAAAASTLIGSTSINKRAFAIISAFEGYPLVSGKPGYASIARACAEVVQS